MSDDVVINAIMLIQNLNPNLKLKYDFAMKNCITHVTNCTHRLVKAAPCDLNIGMNMKLSVRFIMTPTTATKFNCLRFPFAVKSVPKMYVTDIETKLPIRICSILDDSYILLLYSVGDSFSWIW